MRKILFIILLLTIFQANAQTITSIFGNIDEENPIILDLIKSKAMQRLKYIDQSGPEPYFTQNFPKFSRYDHSIGVYALLKYFETSTAEQIAGLMHDTSHTVFSHLADLIFQQGEARSESYQDNIHDWFLQAMQVDEIIAKYDLKIKDISPKNALFLALEQPYPDMNADRIEYNLHTGLIFNDLDQLDVKNILQALRYKNNKWYFTDIKQAKKLGKLSTYYTKTFWGYSHNIALYTVAGAAVKYAMAHKILTTDDLHFGIDQEVVDLLNNSTDPTLKQLINIIRNIDDYYITTDKHNYDIYQPIKMRGFDPLVMQDKKLQRLSTLSIDFKHDLEFTEQYAKNGVYLKFKNIENKLIMDLLIAANK